MKKILLVLISFFMFLGITKADINIDAPSAILIDQNTGKVLFAKNEHEKRAMASMTKIMSLLLIMEQLDDGSLGYEDEVEITDSASKMGGSQIFLQTGDKYKVKELLKGVAMSSANDAIVALAEKTYGSVESFIDAMNKKVNELGLKNTSFKNVHGLDEEGHYSTPYDMAMIAKELLKHEDILKYTSVYEEYLKKSDGSQLWLVNTNKLVRFYKGVDGLKTGYTQNAGYCLTSTAKKNNLRLISVVMGEDSIEKRSADTVKMLNYGFNTYKVNMIKSKDEVLGKVKVSGGKEEYADVVLMDDAIELLKVNDKISKYNFKLKMKEVKAPVKRGDIIGKVNIYDQNKNIIGSYNLTVKNKVLKASLWDLYKRNLKYTLAYK